MTAVQQAREAKGISRYKLAQLAHVRAGTVRAIERGGPARRSTLRRLARALAVPVATFDGVPVPVAQDPVAQDPAAQSARALARVIANAPEDVTELRRLRHARRWSIRELARHSGVHAATISAVENGHVTPQRRTLALLAGALDVRASELA